MMKKLVLAIAFSFCVLLSASAKEYVLTSPGGKLQATVTVEHTISYSLNHGEDALIVDSPVSMTLSDGVVYGAADKVSKVSRRSVDQMLGTVVYKKDQVRDHFNEMTLKFKEFSLVFRAYDDGVAYRFISHSKKPFNVVSEQATFAFAQDWNMWVPYVCQNLETLETQLFNSFENRYEYCPISKWNKERLAFLPLILSSGPTTMTERAE